MLQTGNAVTSRNMAGCHIKTSRNRNKGAAGATDCLANVVSIILELLRLSGMSSISRNQTWSTQGYIQHPQSVVPSGGQGERSTDWERRSRKPGLPLLVALSLEVGGGGQGERSTDWERRRRKPSLPLLVALSSEVGGVCGALRCSGRAFHSLGAAEQKARSPVVRSSVLRGWRSWSGRAFHRLGAAEQKARSPIACSLVLGGWRRCSGRAFHSLVAAEQKARSPVVQSSVLRGWRRWSGRAFHRLGAAEQKARSPIVRSLVLRGW
ncbi:uncharacterized protein LOC133536104 isoform X1 [Nerophis ophidion]|uniref:uncharacterized protein LOC133536104 isoform X1 n=1 Tax=Nerophis ophidion TaxID=159077 RepID=UPI002AE015B8|nr:uncharacterized protein LOC133536104 isoform X1 [Nerophis ophidion]XP_061732306.1 uncharacterized protein LOC133536104 isoform X1 [Nerophis ophidion]XP_061732314.1 uncharacterized protein LOC133536104 isoform X1 [Nerophis ophidion]XP_061732323.1 uncharacterized protein LOC133536104 isoform X1 [Nerophis ophidion]XP_061732331.1 uncharacterized protein LOC133536104 isoform X1 [Nerophis ophidion]XP_061732338.1 uncharacterized protein LOC133536104 isoform X1 [Nerophis ophidion]